MLRLVPCCRSFSVILGDRGALYASALLLFTGLEEREELLQSKWGNLREISLASMSWTCPSGRCRAGWRRHARDCMHAASALLAWHQQEDGSGWQERPTCSPGHCSKGTLRLGHHTLMRCGHQTHGLGPAWHLDLTEPSAGSATFRLPGPGPFVPQKCLFYGIVADAAASSGFPAGSKALGLPWNLQRCSVANAEHAIGASGKPS